MRVVVTGGTGFVGRHLDASVPRAVDMDAPAVGVLTPHPVTDTEFVDLGELLGRPGGNRC